MLPRRRFHFVRHMQLLLVMIAGCTVGPDYSPPQVHVAGSYFAGPGVGRSPGTRPTSRPAAIAEGSMRVTQWWALFNDPTLNALIDQATQSNLDMKLAAARVREARALRAIVTGGQYPSVEAQAGYSHQRLSQNAAPYNAFSIPGFPWEFDLYQAGFDASWEIDVFGRVRRAVQAANAEVGASIEDRRNVLLTLLAETARNYAELRGLQRQLAIAQQNQRLGRQTVELTRNRVANGVAPELDLTRAQAQSATTSARIPFLRSEVDQALTRLAVLLGIDAVELEPQLMPADQPGTQGATAEALPKLPTLPPQVPIGLPSDLLRRRPDIRRAERQLASAMARIGVAVADFFPQFSLSGNFTMQAADIGSLGDFKSRSFGMGPSIVWPIFEGGRLRAGVDLRTAQQQQALANYQITVINAVREVRDAITAFGYEQDRRSQLAEAVAANRKSVEMSRQMYEQGLVDFLSVLDAQRSLFVSEDVLAQSEQTVLTDLIALYKALGGGWEIELIPR
jgi:multidrug efflux system outer membrane protein